MFGVCSNRNRRRKRSWLLDFILGNTTHTKGQIVKVCRHVGGPHMDGSITKQVSDGSLFINAVFTKEAIDSYSFDDEICTPPEWDQAMLIIKDYSLNFTPAPCLADCKFSLEIKKFSLIDLHDGFDSKNQIHDCMGDPQVQHVARYRWTQWMSQDNLTEESMPGTNLSLLLDEVMCPLTQEQPEPSTSKASAPPEEKQSREDMSETWARLKQMRLIEDWVISQSQLEVLDSIEEWKEDYIPPPSLSSDGQSRSGSGEAESYHSENSKVKGLTEKTSLSENSGDAANLIMDKDVRMQSHGQKSPKVTGDASSSSKRKTVKMAEGKDKCQYGSVQATSPDGDGGNQELDTDTISKKSANTKCDKSGKKEAGPLKSSDATGSSEEQRSERSEGDGSPDQPKSSFGNEYLKFLKCEHSKKSEQGIKILEVFTLDTLETAWHIPSPDSEKFSCSLPSDSQASQENSQELTSDSSHQDPLQSAPDDRHQADSTVRDDQPPVDASAVHNTDPISHNTPAKDKGSPKSVTKHKYSTPESTQRHRLDSVFNKSIDASCIVRASTSSEILPKNSTGDDGESVLFEVDIDIEKYQGEERPTSDKVSGGEKNKYQGHLGKRVSFAPSVLFSSPENQKGTEQFDVTDSTQSIYVDAKSHLSSPGSCSAHPELRDYPMSQPFTPSNLDLLAEDTGTTEVETGTTNRSFDADSCDSVLLISVHHSTQSSDAPPSRPDLSISPIREGTQNDAHSQNKLSCDSLDKLAVSTSSDMNSSESNNSSVVVETEVPQERLSSVKGADFARAPEDSQRDKHPSFAESGSEEHIPLSGVSGNVKKLVEVQNGDDVSDLKARKYTVMLTKIQDSSKECRLMQVSSLLQTSAKELGKRQTSKEIALSVSRLKNKDQVELDSDNCEKGSDLVVIDQYSTDSSGTETKKQSSTSRQDVSQERNSKHGLDSEEENEITVKDSYVPDTQDAIQVVRAVKRMEKDEYKRKVTSRKQSGFQDSSDSQDSQDPKVIVIGDESDTEDENDLSVSPSMLASETATSIKHRGKKVPDVSQSHRHDRQGRDRVTETVTSTAEDLPVGRGRNVELKRQKPMCSDAIIGKKKRPDTRDMSDCRFTEDLEAPSKTTNFPNVKEKFITTRRLRLSKNENDSQGLSLRKRLNISPEEESGRESGVSGGNNLSDWEMRSNLSCPSSRKVDGYKTVPDGSTRLRLGKKKTLVEMDTGESKHGSSGSYSDLSSNVVDEMETDKEDHSSRRQCSKRKSDVEKMFTKTLKKYGLGEYASDKEKENVSQSTSHSSRHQPSLSNNTRRETSPAEEMFLRTVKKYGTGKFITQEEKDNSSHSTANSRSRREPSPSSTGRGETSAVGTHPGNIPPACKSNTKIPSATYTSVGSSCQSTSIMHEEMDSSSDSPSIQTLLDFLDMEPLKDRRLLAYRTSQDMRKRIYKIYQKPISYLNKSQ